MSRAGDCGACMAGNHAQHDRNHGIRRGVIGGTYCDCSGDCDERALARGEELRALLTAPDPTASERQCSQCGALWMPVRRGECVRCGSDAGPASPPVAASTGSERCHHCGALPDADGDHSCPCPLSNSECLEHTLNPVAASTGTSDDVELAAWLRDWSLSGCEHGLAMADGRACSPCLRDRILASDWLAAREAAARAEGAAKALADFADALDNDDAAMDVALTGVDYVIQRLTDRAACIAREGR